MYALKSHSNRFVNYSIVFLFIYLVVRLDFSGFQFFPDFVIYHSFSEFSRFSGSGFSAFSSDFSPSISAPSPFGVSVPSVCSG